MAGLTGWHFLIILAVVLLLFGATKLPALAKGLGESMRIFKSEIKKPEDSVAPRVDVADSTTPAAPVTPVNPTNPGSPADPTPKP